MKEIALMCGLLSGGFGAASALAFLKGSKVMPWDMQSYKGQTEAEKAFRDAAQSWQKLGLIWLVVAFLLSMGASVAGYFT
jgi:hypothetical protein